MVPHAEAPPGRWRPRLISLVLTAGALAWALYWAERFFRARGEAEAAMDSLQRLLARGFADPALAARVEAALAESHRALAFALGGPVLLLLLAFAALWWRGSRGR